MKMTRLQFVAAALGWAGLSITVALKVNPFLGLFVFCFGLGGLLSIPRE